MAMWTGLFTLMKLSGNFRILIDKKKDFMKQKNGCHFIKNKGNSKRRSDRKNSQNISSIQPNNLPFGTAATIRRQIPASPMHPLTVYLLPNLVFNNLVLSKAGNSAKYNINIFRCKFPVKLVALYVKPMITKFTASLET